MLSRTLQLAVNKQWTELYEYRFKIEKKYLLNKSVFRQRGIPYTREERERAASYHLMTCLENYEYGQSGDDCWMNMTPSFHTKIKDVCLAALLDVIERFK